MNNNMGLIKKGSMSYDIEFVRDGRSDYTVIIPANAGECTRYAAEELCTFVKKCTGAELPVITDSEYTGGRFISFGNTLLYESLGLVFDFGKLNNDGFLIKTDGFDIFINAYVERGLLYAAYDFLEKFLGVRFIASDTTVLPEKLNVILPPLNIVEIPDFKMRGYLEESMYEDSNYTGADQDFAQRRRAQHAFLEPDAKHGGRNICWSRGGSHNFCCYVDPAIYDNPDDKKNYHPEFFWHRKAEYDDESSVTICLTNGITEDGKLDETMEISVAKIMIEELKKDVIANPDIVYFGIEQEDGPIRCCCDRCMRAEEKYKRSGMLIRFCNVIVEEVNKWAEKELDGRKIYINTFAYSYAAEAPVKTADGKTVPLDSTVVANDHLVMRLCFGRNILYSAFSNRQTEGLKKMLRNWKCVAKTLFGWSYDGLFDRYFLFAPSFHCLKDDFTLYNNFGISYLVVNDLYNTKGLWQVKLRAYIGTELMWNVSSDENILYEEFLTHYFGEPAKKYIKKFISEYYAFYDGIVAEKPDFQLWSYAMQDKNAFPKSLLLKTLDLAEKARKAVWEADLPDEKKKLFDKHIAETELNSLFPLVEHYTHYFPEKTEKDYYDFAKKFVDKCEYVGATNYAETRSIKFFVDRNYHFDY